MPMGRPLFILASETEPPRTLIIAELGVNHDGSVDRALELVRAAAEAGADAVKMQLFRPERLLSNQALLAAYQEGKAGDPQELLRKLVLPMDGMRAVRDAARAAGLWFIATPFSLEDVGDAAELGLDAVKIASPDAVNPPLFRAASDLGRPILISTGTCTLEECEEAARLLHSHRAGGALLQCVSAYPTAIEDAALAGIGVLRERFELHVGYSDHTRERYTGALAVAAGASILEKHLTYDTAAVGPDHAASLDSEGFAEYVDLVRTAERAMGPVRKAVLPVEQDVRRVSRQSVCVLRDLPAGHVVTEDDVTVKRPGTGIPAAGLDGIIGRRLARPVRNNDLLTPEDLAPVDR